VYPIGIDTAVLQKRLKACKRHKFLLLVQLRGDFDAKEQKF